jgi:NAD+ synthase (glutamine-hydrolysing)
MRVAIAQINTIVGDLRHNRDLIISAINEAKKANAALVVFPEMALCGYPPEDLVLLSGFIHSLEEELHTIVKASMGIAVVLGTIRKNPAKGEKSLCNTAAVIENGRLLGFQDKTLLPTYDVFSERRYFEPAEKNIPWHIAGKSVGVTICEDLWEHAKEVGYSNYPRDPILELKKHPLDLALNLSASPYYVGRPKVRIEVARKAALTVNRPLLLCNQVGGNDSLLFDGHSCYLDAAGNLCALGKGFCDDLLIIDTDQKNPQVTYNLSEAEEIFSALSMGVRDYFGKLGFKKAILGLSGGIDSAIVACIAKEALGPENVQAIGMPSRFTSKQSIEDAKQLADHLNISIEMLSIEEPFESFLHTLEPSFKGTKWDVTEENLQARIRGTLLMSLSNKFGSLVLSCANKSEMSMGYSTLYGDMCGALAILGDLSKGQIYLLANWINSRKTVIPKSILEKEPTAELKHDQKDTDTLPPYEIVDLVLKEYVEEALGPVEIAQRHSIDLQLVKDLLRKIHLNEYKRRQSPPVLRVTKKAFNVGRVFPIVQHWNI